MKKIDSSEGKKGNPAIVDEVAQGFILHATKGNLVCKEGRHVGRTSCRKEKERGGGTGSLGKGRDKSNLWTGCALTVVGRKLGGGERFF